MSAITEARRKDIINTYHAFMRSIKNRLEWAGRIADGQFMVPAWMARDSCFLQLRMLCELTAMACLTAHGDISATKPLRKEWSSGKIITALEKLHPDFYPKPMTGQTILPQPQMGPMTQFDPVESGFLTKKDLIDLANRRCGTMLHQGKIDDILIYGAPPPPRLFAEELAECRDWLHKFHQLLRMHSIFLVGDKDVIICELSYVYHGGDVAVAFGRRVPE